MACFASNLQLVSLVVHEAKIHDVVYDDIGAKKARKWHQCLSKSLDWRLEKVVGWRGWCVWWESKGDIQVACNGILYHYFLAYGNLSGYNVKGHCACLIYEKEISYVKLKHGIKKIYTRHRCFLKSHHPYQWLKKAFNGS